jgi:hypothetical protein
LSYIRSVSLAGVAQNVELLVVTLMAKLEVANSMAHSEGLRELGWARPIDLGHDITSYLLHMLQDTMRNILVSTL